MHYDILTSDLIQRAAQLARSLGHSYVGSAHLLLVMAREPGAVGQTLRLLGMDPDLTEAMARLLYGQGTPELPLPQGLTGESRELLRGAAREAKHLGSREITPQHLLLAMARRENSDAYELLKLNGVGEKVANCVVLFGLYHMEAFPIDVWIRRALKEHFPPDFDPASLGDCAGLAQQYIFYYARSHGNE